MKSSPPYNVKIRDGVGINGHGKGRVLKKIFDDSIRARALPHQKSIFTIYH